MVSVVQMVEHQVVILAVAGSSPVTHPEWRTPCSGGGFFFISPQPEPSASRSRTFARSRNPANNPQLTRDCFPVRIVIIKKKMGVSVESDRC